MKVLSTVASVIALGTSAVDGLRMNGSKMEKQTSTSPVPMESGVNDALPSLPGSPRTRIPMQLSPQPDNEADSHDGLQMKVDGPDETPISSTKKSLKARRRVAASAPATRIALAAISETPIGSDDQAGDVQGPKMKKWANTADWKILNPIVGRLKCSWPSSDSQDPPKAADPIDLKKKEWRTGYLLGVELDGKAAVLFDDTKEVGKIPVNRCFQNLRKESRRRFDPTPRQRQYHHTRNHTCDTDWTDSSHLRTWFWGNLHNNFMNPRF